jgi:hypothetical protein
MDGDDAARGDEVAVGVDTRAAGEAGARATDEDDAGARATDEDDAGARATDEDDAGARATDEDEAGARATDEDEAGARAAGAAGAGSRAGAAGVGAAAAGGAAFGKPPRLGRAFPAPAAAAGLGETAGGPPSERGGRPGSAWADLGALSGEVGGTGPGFAPSAPGRGLASTWLPPC